MEFLLDTHTVIWSIASPKLVSEKSEALITNPDNKCFVSIASLWEIAIKSSMGKLELNDSLEHIFKIIIETGFEILPISSVHILKLAQLPFHHRDPFDRILIAQAKIEELTIITKDEMFNHYDIKIVWT